MIRLSPVLLLLTVLGACVDGGNTDDKPNEDSAPTNITPSATITSHADNDTVREGDLITLRGTVSDEDASAGELLASWTVAGTEVCAPAAPNADGETSCDVRFLPDGGAVTLTVEDPDGATGTASVNLTVTATDAPTATILAPVTSGLYYSDIPVALMASVADTEDAATALSVSWEDDVAGVLTGLATTPAADGSLSESVAFAAGAHLLSLTVTDTDGKQAVTSVSFTVGGPNALPTCGITAPASGSAALVGDSVHFEGNAGDTNVAAELLTATWTSDLDGVLSTGPVGADGVSSFDVATLGAGTHLISFDVVDEVGGACASAVSLTVGTPPELIVLSPLDGDVVNDGEGISFTGMVADNEEPASDLSITWESDLDGVIDSTPADAAGTLGFSAQLTAGNHTITVTATDSAGFSDVESFDLTVNGLPSAPTVTLAPDPATTTDTLVATATGSVDPDGSGSVSYSYAWYVDGVLSAGSTSDTLPADATTKHETWTVVVTPDDGTGSGSAGWAELTISNSTPVLSTPTLSATSARVGDVVACGATATDDDGDSVGLTYTWTNASSGAVIASGESYTLTAADTEPGDSLFCTVSADDGDSGTATADSAPLTVLDTDPVLSTVSVTPSTGNVGDSFSCSATATDADEGTPSLSYSWTVGGTTVGTGDTYVATAADTNPGDSLTCTVTADDGDGGTATGSASVLIGNSAPTLSGTSVSPSTALVGASLVCSTTAADADGGTPTLDYAWSVGGSTIATGSSYTVSEADTNPGDTVTCTVTATDTDGGTVSDSASAAVGNSAPTISSVSVSPATAAVGETFTCAASATDADGGTPTLTYGWTNGGTVLGSGSTYVVTAADTDPGDTITCNVRATDADGGRGSDSATGTVADTLPTAPTVTITPSAPVETVDDLICAASGSTDADGQAVSYVATWTVDGVAFAGTSTTTMSGDTVPAASTLADEEWVCTVTPVAGGASGASGSASVIIDSNLPDLVVDGVSYDLAEGSYEYDDIEVINGGELVINGLVILEANSFYLEAGSTVNGDEAGGAGGTSGSSGVGTGAGTGSSTGGAGGGSHGGTGGTGGYDSGDSPGVGGATYGDTGSTSIDSGSGGGSGTSGGTGAAGGGAIFVYARDISCDGDISMNGGTGIGSGRSGGGGSGGGILLVGESVEVTGTLMADGGDGGSGTSTANDGGGGGGGGRIKLFSELPLVITGSYSVTGGAGGVYGSGGYGSAGADGVYTTGSITY